MKWNGTLERQEMAANWLFEVRSSSISMLCQTRKLDAGELLLPTRLILRYRAAPSEQFGCFDQSGQGDGLG